MRERAAAGTNTSRPFRPVDGARQAFSVAGRRTSFFFFFLHNWSPGGSLRFLYYAERDDFFPRRGSTTIFK